MEDMNRNVDDSEEDGAEALETGILEALRHSDSAQAGPSAETDAAILRMAKSRMALIRRRSAVKRAFIGIGAAAACVALALFLVQQAGPSAKPAPKVTLDDDSAAIILKEISAVFPGQIQSILRDESGLQLSLADAPRADPGQAVVLEIQRNGDSREIISFSGQTVEIMGRKVTIHTSADGHIHLKGPGMEWLSERPKRPLPDLKIRARLI